MQDVHNRVQCKAKQQFVFTLSPVFFLIQVPSKQENKKDEAGPARDRWYQVITAGERH